MSLRPVKRVVLSKPTLEGAGVHLRRAFGFGNVVFSLVPSEGLGNGFGYANGPD